MFNQEIQSFPEFFINHYKHKIANKLIEQINKFKAEFVTATEEEWIIFVREEKKQQMVWENKAAYLPKDLNLELLRAAFSIIVVMPIKPDIKHDWHILETKIARIQKAWNLTPPLRCSWQITEQDL